MNSFDITMIGHISKDIMIYKQDVQKFTGGPVIYSSIAAARSGKRIQVITCANDQDDFSLDGMRSEGVAVFRIDSEATTSIENIYYTADREKRDVTLLSQAAAFTLDTLPSTDSTIYHLAGLFRGEIPDSFIPYFSKKGQVGVDAQGLLRCSEGGKLLFRNWENLALYMPEITYFKTDAAEAEILTGFSDREKAASVLASYGAKEVMVTHNNEVLICAGDKFFRAPYNPKNLSGRTGRGDTTFAAYMAKRLDAPIEESVFYAAALCSIKMETPGPFKGSSADVYERMEQIGFKG
jgi:sugar/nucleoside kinase (ribokinase family)